MFAQASVRILLSDTSGAITSLPGVSLQRDADRAASPRSPIPGYVIDADHAPLASSAVVGDGYRSPVSTPLHGGFSKSSIATPPMRGRTSRSNGSTSASSSATSIRPAAPSRTSTRSSGCSVGRRRRQRPRSLCGPDSVVETDYWPLALYDTREVARGHHARGQHHADGQRGNALHRARRQQLPPLAAGSDRSLGRQRGERGRLRHPYSTACNRNPGRPGETGEYG